MQRDGKSTGADVFAEGEQRVMTLQISQRAVVFLVDFDLFDAGIAFDVEDALALGQVLMQVERAADIQDRVRFAVKFAHAFPAKADGRVIIEIARPVCPSSGKTKLLRERAQSIGGVIVGDLNLVLLRVVGSTSRVLDVVNFVAEAQQADDVMNVLPDHARNGAGGHEAHDDDAFSFHGVVG